MSRISNKNILLIFDGAADADKITGLITPERVGRIDLFALTGDSSLLQKVETGLISEGFNDIFKYNTAALIDEQVGVLREKICKWSADIGSSKVWRKSIKEWLLLPGCGVSAWWFGLFADKSPFKTDSFFRISQVGALRHVLGIKKYDLILLASGDRNFRTAVRNVAAISDVPVKAARPAQDDSWKDSLCVEIVRAFRFFFNFLRNKYIVSARLPSKKSRFHRSGSILIMSYFPCVEKESAQKGIFRNCCMPVLQDKFKEANLPVTWVLMYVPMDGFGFKDAVDMAKAFAVKGEKMFFLEEFLSIADAARGLFLWIRQVFISQSLFNFMDKAPLNSPPVGRENAPFIRSLWKTSFCGPTGLMGILFALAFRKMFRDIRDVKDCLYYFEMQPWEHALNSVKCQLRPGIRSIGIQHSSIPRNSFNHFFDKSDIRRTAALTDLPLPDVLACSGEIARDILADAGYPAVTRVEAIRYLYLDKALSSSIDPAKKRRVLLVAGSGSRGESINLIALIKSAFPRAVSFEICFRSHPHFPFKELFDDLGIDAQGSGYILSHDDIETALDKAFAVITPSSTVAIEALAFDCEVIVPVFPDLLSQNPLDGFERYYHKITDGDALASTVEDILRSRKLYDAQEYRKFVRRYWDIDKNIPRWKELLNLNV